MIGAGAAVVKEDRDAVGGGESDEVRQEDCMEGWNVGGKKLGAVKG